MTTFKDLGLTPLVLKALEEEGYEAPTPIQAQAIPEVLAKHDLLGIAQTGTGKTAAFALPILHRLAEDKRPAPRRGCRALILSPTRELATQIAESFRNYGRHLGLSVAVVFGGVAARPQIKALSRGVDVLVAAPGRLLDHMGERHADISGTEIFVLDEADQMLDLGFFKPIRQIVSHLSHRRQNLFFSATMPKEISGLASELLQDPVEVSVAPVATTAERVSQRVIFVERQKKRALLEELLKNEEMERTLVFARTKRGADRIAQQLDRANIKAAAIHGNKSQRQRESALADFRKSHVRVLVATDIAARGIDIDLVSHVINFELPEVPEAYVHRIGRTARAGASGIAITLCSDDERNLLRAIERTTRQKIDTEDRRNDDTLKATPARRPVETASADGDARDRADRKPKAFRNGSKTNTGPHREKPFRKTKPQDGAPRGDKKPRTSSWKDRPRQSDTKHGDTDEASARNARRPAHARKGGDRKTFDDRPARKSFEDRPARKNFDDRPARTKKPANGRFEKRFDDRREDRGREDERPRQGKWSDRPTSSKSGGDKGQTFEGRKPNSKTPHARTGARPGDRDQKFANGKPKTKRAGANGTPNGRSNTQSKRSAPSNNEGFQPRRRPKKFDQKRSAKSLEPAE